jgi:hypothetical protein
MLLETDKPLNNPRNCAPREYARVGLPLIRARKYAVCYNTAAGKGFRDRC